VLFVLAGKDVDFKVISGVFAAVDQGGDPLDEFFAFEIGKLVIKISDGNRSLLADVRAVKKADDIVLDIDDITRTVLACSLISRRYFLSP